MIYKVYFQETTEEVPVRERTRAIYVEGNSEIEIRRRLEETTQYNIEYIQLLDEKYLEYEKQSENFKITEI